MWVTVDQQKDYLTWRPDGGDVAVRIANSAIERMNVEVMAGFGVTRRRGTEVGGVLIGRVEQRDGKALIWIEDYESVPCEYAFGPSYLLSANDEPAFRDAVQRWSAGDGKALHSVGYFRSHTRQGMFLDQEDAALFAQHFQTGINLVLLVKPFASRANRASIFVPAAGELRPQSTSGDFLFACGTGMVQEQAAPVAQQAVPPRAAPVVVPVQSPPPPAEPVPMPEPAAPALAPLPLSKMPEVATPRKPSEADKVLAGVLGPRGTLAFDEDDDYGGAPQFGAYGSRSRSRLRRLTAWVAFTLAVLAFGGVAGFQYAGGRMASSTQTTASVPEVAAPDPYALKLAVEQQDAGLLVRWDRNAPVVQAADGGLLVVTEQNGSKEVQLSSEELRTGTVIYRHIAADITFRLEVILPPNRRFVETLTWSPPVQANPPPAPASEPPRN